MPIDADTPLDATKLADLTPQEIFEPFNSGCAYTATEASDYGISTTVSILVTKDDVRTSALDTVFEAEGWNEVVGGWWDSYDLEAELWREAQWVDLTEESGALSRADLSDMRDMFPGATHALLVSETEFRPGFDTDDSEDDDANDDTGTISPAPDAATTAGECSSLSGEASLMTGALSVAYGSNQYSQHPMSLMVELTELQGHCVLKLTSILDPGSSYSQTDMEGILSLVADNADVLVPAVEFVQLHLADEHMNPQSLAEIVAEAGGDAEGITTETGVRFPVDLFTE